MISTTCKHCTPPVLGNESSSNRANTSVHLPRRQQHRLADYVEEKVETARSRGFGWLGSRGGDRADILQSIGLPIPKTFFLHSAALSTNPTDLESPSTFIRLPLSTVLLGRIKAGFGAAFFSPLPPFLITLLPCCKLYTLSIPTLALLSLVTQTPLAHFLSSLFPAVQNAFHDDLRYACECASAGVSRHESPSGYYNHGGPVRKLQPRRSFTAVAGSLGCRQRRRLDESVHPVLQSAAIRHPNEQQ
ncbi:hypothetical protein PGT21_036382 [Puccinia graminis f. sp. tritici]|uniref:Uncharacterized protein n=1 Tax=Puccinia graminis f. sp. tritici TaxID=56615 RepID=A0A5B0NQY1_PUCGR|nr:hypothetical protein PGTUg99_037553 [Puccinia graminis f. sp. tritici]KAA1091631.1 hypothetical protein PGT21_036382 [Puccinia graminis f. sp. tritici]